MGRRRGLLWQTLTTLFTRGMAAGAAFAMHLLIARLLGAAGTGLFFLSLAIMRGALEPGRFGLHQSIVRFAAPLLHEGDRRGAAVQIGTGGAMVLAFSIASAAAVSLLCFAVLPGILPERAAVWELSAFFVWTAAPVAVLSFSAGVIQAFARPAVASFLEAAATPTLTCLGLGAAWAMGAASSPLTAAIYFAASAAAALTGAALARRRLAVPLAFGRDEARTLLRASHPLLVVNAMRYVFQNLPLLALGMIAAADTVGVFSVAHRLAMTLSIMLTAVNNVMYARFAVAWKKGDRARLERELQLSALILLAAGLPAIGVLGVFRHEILGLLGPDFVEGGTLLLVLLAGQVVNLATASSGAVLAMTGNERALRRNSVISGAAVVVMSAVLIPTLGALGAAISVSGAIMLQSTMAAWQSWRLAGVRVLSPDMLGAVFRRGRR